MMILSKPATIPFLLLVSLSVPSHAQAGSAARTARPKPDLQDVRYGPHRRNVLDLYLAKIDEPAPLVLYIHGGGFRGGDKRSINARRLKAYLNVGFSVAAVNYRLTDTAPAPAAYLDCARALQFLRLHAKRWNLNPDLVASTGGSAGAGTSMWIAFHDDLADPKSSDPIARQSTRLTCIAVDNGQSSYDPRFAEKIGIPRPNFERHPFFLPFYGITSEDIDTEKAYKRYEMAAPITYVTADDPPALLSYSYPNEEVTERTNLGLIVHHPKFGLALKERLDALGIECHVQYRGQPEVKRIDPVAFIRRNFEGARRRRGTARAVVTRPKHFPHRIWAACDFEARTPDFGWFGPVERKNIPAYPGNTTALGVGARPYKDFSAIMTGINPVPGPRMGEVNHLFLRYRLEGATEATFQHFSLSSNDNNHIRVSGLTEGTWSEVTMNFTRDGRRNDGTPGVPFKKGERMDDLKIFVGKPGDGKRYDLVIDDVIFFAEDPALPPDSEPFPNRVIFLAAFDTGPKEKYWPGAFEIVEKGLPAGSYWRVARAVPHRETGGKWIRLTIDPPRPVGAHTKLRFRYHLTGTSGMTVQIFDLTDRDNRHIRLSGLKGGSWNTVHLDFSSDARRNDGRTTPFAAGHIVDDIFFFVAPEAGADVELLIDEVVLYDAGKP